MDNAIYKSKVPWVKSFFNFISDVFSQKQVILELAINDFKARFASSFLGIIWAYIQPLITILVFWFVFELGFKNPPVEGIKFIAWFTPAYIAWTFFADGLMSTTNCLMEYSFLLRKVNFRVSMIPVVKIVSSTFIHVPFIIFIFILNCIYKVPISIFNVQVFYYFFCTCFLLIGLGWFLSAIAVFVKDTVNIINVFIQIGFWLTPIFWSPDNISPEIKKILLINPMFYICQGYRDSFINHIWFWENGFINIYFWAVTLLLFFTGALVFKKLRPHFVDML